MMRNEFLRHITAMTLMLVLGATAAMAQDNDMILNREFADRKLMHFGFSVGANFQNLSITNNGFVTDNGEAWFADIPNHNPGFCVNVLADYRLGEHFNLRFSPGMYFGNKVVKFVNANVLPDEVDPSKIKSSQNIKSTYVVLPLDLKCSAKRYHNMRPYFTGGVMGVYDVSKDHPDQIKTKDMDVMLTLGMGCDFYLPYFKLCPELKFCFGLKNILQTNRPDLQDNPEMYKFTQSVSKVQDNMVVLTFYFE